MELNEKVVGSRERYQQLPKKAKISQKIQFFVLFY